LETENQNTDKIQEEKKEINPDELKEEVIKVLKMCYDPEIPVNIYDLGLIYDVKIAANGDVLVIMTLTSPACPVAGSLPIEVQEKLKEHPMINDARVEITFDPPWGLDRMSEEAKLELGFL
jgi:FeS assembly SUF system protein